MSGAGPMVPNAAVEAAIASVLASERDARDAIARAREQAADVAEDARAAARMLGERTDARILAVRAAFGRRLSQRVDRIRSEAAALDMPRDLSDDDLARLEWAVAQLAAELTGAAR